MGSGGAAGLGGGLRGALVCLLLLAAVLIAYRPVLDNGFVNFDDHAYLTEGSLVRDGLTARGLAWAFTTTHTGNWHPLTWLSHMADVQLFGMDPRGHHAAGLILHGANTVLLFLVLRAMTGALWPAAAVAALFGLHPLHVESVAWAAERKDLLCAFFWILATAGWVHYARRPGPWRYAAAFALLGLALLAKPMAVTAPFVFLLLDWWPLGRFGPPAGGIRRDRAARLLLEKLPLLALAAASSVVTLVVQHGSGAVRTLESFPLGERAANAAVAAATYAYRAAVPRGLAVFYPHPETMPPAGKLLGAALLLAAATALAVALARRVPALLVGWAWFLGTLVPVIGLVQVGGQAMADRYTYVPLVGLFIAGAWGAGAAARGRAAARRALAASTMAALLACAALTWRQAGFWRDDFTLYGRALSAAGPSWVVWNNLGTAWFDRGDLRRAEDAYRSALEVRPGQPEALVNLGITLARQGRVPEAQGRFRSAALADPGYAKARLNLGLALAWGGGPAAALAELREAARLEPDWADAQLALGVALEAAGLAAEGEARLRAAELLDPDAPRRAADYERILGRAAPGRLPR